MNKEVPGEAYTRNRIKQILSHIKKAEARLKAATSKSNKRDWQEALNDLKVELAWQYLDAEKVDKALSIYKKLPKKKYEQDICYGKARILIDSRQYDDALNLIDDAVSKFPFNINFLNLLSILHFETGNYYESLRYADRGNSLMPQDPELLHNKARALTALQYFKEASKCWDELLEVKSDDLSVVSEVAEFELKRGNASAAVEGFRKVFQKGHKSPDVYLHLCQAYIAMGCPLGLAIKGVRKFPEEPMLYWYIGRGYVQLDHFEEAKKVLEQGFALDPDSKIFPELLKVVATAMKPKSAKK